MDLNDEKKSPGDLSTTENAGEEKKSETIHRKDKFFKNKKVLLPVFLIVSMIISFASVFFWFGKQPQQQDTNDASGIGADSTVAAIDTVSVFDSKGMENEVRNIADSTITVAEEKPTSDQQIDKSPLEVSTIETVLNNSEETDADMKVKLLRYLSQLRKEITSNRDQARELSKISGERDGLLTEVESLKEKQKQQERELRYYQETLLLKSIENKITEYQKVVENQQQQQTAGTSNGRTNAGQTQTENAGYKKLAKIYEAMRPENAAPILAKLNDDQILGILSNMRQRQAAKVMTNFDPNLAARISKKFPGN